MFFLLNVLCIIIHYLLYHIVSGFAMILIIFCEIALFTTLAHHKLCLDIVNIKVRVRINSFLAVSLYSSAFILMSMEIPSAVASEQSNITDKWSLPSLHLIFANALKINQYKCPRSRNISKPRALSARY